MLHLNEIKPQKIPKKLLSVSVVEWCGKGKTCGRGHKGQTARSGYSKKNRL